MFFYSQQNACCQINFTVSVKQCWPNRPKISHPGWIFDFSTHPGELKPLPGQAVFHVQTDNDAHGVLLLLGAAAVVIVRQGVRQMSRSRDRIALVQFGRVGRVKAGHLQSQKIN